MPKDITIYNDQELSNYFLNDEFLYDVLVNSSWDYVEQVAIIHFVFTSDQLADLRETYLEMY